MKKGKTPSLIGSGAGSVKSVTSGRLRYCKRCEMGIAKDSICIEVSIPGSMGSKTYCTTCFAEILDQTEKDIAKLRENLPAIRPKDSTT